MTAGGLLHPDEGTVTIDDVDLYAIGANARAIERGRKIGFVFQRFHLIPYLTAAQNVMVPLALKHVDKREQEKRAARILEEVGLGGRANHLPRQLSVGQQQRVAIARAFANEPDVILADEPTGNLDPSLSEDILGLLESLHQREGTTIVMVTHSPEAALRGSMRVHLADGRLAPEAVAAS